METLTLNHRTKVDVRSLPNLSKFARADLSAKSVGRSKATLAAAPIAADPSFGAWAAMEKADAELCADIKSSRHFRERKLSL